MFNVLVPFKMLHTTVKSTSRKMKNDLRENVPSCIHKFDFNESMNQIVTVVLTT